MDLATSYLALLMFTINTCTVGFFLFEEVRIRHKIRTFLNAEVCNDFKAPDQRIVGLRNAVTRITAAALPISAISVWPSPREMTCLGYFTGLQLALKRE
ncbi:MAG: hypothetical protein HY040_02115 [Planctomycetes bacterium]|nr:hypothetical protein [Planctomycetota bacterium]